jgi:hypothetical protein
MAFDLELLKTEVTDLLHRTEAKIGPWLADLKTAFHAVADQVHRQALADETAAKNAVLGAVKTVETQVTQDVADAEAAVKGGGGKASK